MKRISFTQYTEGIASLLQFTELLGQALREALPGVRLRKVSAYGWRGYQIVHYPGLKDGHYFCQLDLGAPGVLALMEYYELQYYPFRVHYDLTSYGFFTLTADEQRQLLKRLVVQATTEALDWNQSERRKQVVHERVW